MILPFPAWTPDLPDFRNPGVLTATNVYRTAAGYRPVQDLSVITNALSGRCLGAITATDSSGNVYIYAGTSATLEEAVSSTFTDESKGGGYSTAAGDGWNFVVFGSTILAVNGTDELQYIDIGGGSSGAFANRIVSGDSPTGKYIAVVRDQVILGFVKDEAGTTSNRIRWCGINDPTSWDESTTTLADKQDLPEGGPVRGLAGGIEYGLVFQDTMIRRLTFAGGQAIYRIEPIAQKTGCAVPNSVTSHDRRTFFISDEGFCVVEDGSYVRRIGSEKVDRTFWDQFDITNAPGVSTAIDERNKMWLVAFPGTGASSDIPNKIWSYNWELDEWGGEIQKEVEWLASGATQGMNVDSGIISDIDGDATYASESIDGDIFKGGELRIGAFKTDHKLYHFIGSPLAATITTTEDQPIAGRMTRVRAARPVMDTDTACTITPLTRDRQVDSRSTGTAVTVDSTGECKDLGTARYFAFQLDTTAGTSWSHAQGVEIPPDGIADAGRR